MFIDHPTENPVSILLIAGPWSGYRMNVVTLDDNQMIVDGETRDVDVYERDRDNATHYYHSPTKTANLRRSFSAAEPEHVQMLLRRFGLVELRREGSD
jgi:hypothetical protein